MRVVLRWGFDAAFRSRPRDAATETVEAVNILGSLFYGSLLGVFILAFFFKRVGGTAAFLGMLAGEAAILCAFAFTKISFLWYNVVGCLVVMGTGVLLTAVGSRKP